MRREIVRIDEARCDGCGLCVPSCAEGAIAVIGGKARLVSESLCDGMGACLGHCPRGAITVERVEAAPFEAAGLARQREPAPTPEPPFHQPMVACPGSRPMVLEPAHTPAAPEGSAQRSALRQWPVQLHLVSPASPAFRSADVLLAADCVAYAVGEFHRDHLAGRALAIACPKLDAHQELYLEKLVTLIDGARIASLTVMVMEVPCCSGLVRLARLAAERAARALPVHAVVVSVHGDVRAPADEPVQVRSAVSLPRRSA